MCESCNKEVSIEVRDAKLDIKYALLVCRFHLNSCFQGRTQQINLSLQANNDGSRTGREEERGREGGREVKVR